MNDLYATSCVMEFTLRMRGDTSSSGGHVKCSPLEGAG